jgi:hypothetical protein
VEGSEIIDAFLNSKKALKERLTEIDKTLVALQAERKNVKGLLKGTPRGAAKEKGEAKPRKPRKRGLRPAATPPATATA